MEVPSVGGLYTSLRDAYETRESPHVTLFRNLKYVDCITRCGATRIIYPVVPLGKERNYLADEVGERTRLLKLNLLAKYLEE